MLSRVADSLYWMSRYLERAEHTARLLDVTLQQMLDQATVDTTSLWVRLLQSLHMPPLDDANDPYGVTQLLTFDVANNSSIVSCIAAARENARQVREQISSEMWEQLNRLYLRVKRTTMEEIWYAEPHRFFAGVKDGVHLFQGITDATMSHSEGWHFIRVGRFLERAMATAVLLDVHFLAWQAEQPQPESESSQLDYLRWVGLLRSCSSFEAYNKVYMATVAFQPDTIAEFLLLNEESPRSVRFAASMMQTALQAIAKLTNTRTPGRAERVVGRLRAALDYDQIEEVMSGGLHAYLDNIQRQCAQIHNAIYQTYVSYPIEVAITARGAGQA
jgi:uncharacterized alpha-E superfamily protein